MPPGGKLRGRGRDPAPTDPRTGTVVMPIARYSDDRPSNRSMPRDKRGWRVVPAPDGRGMPEEHKPRPAHRLRGFWIFFVALLAINSLSVLAFHPGAQARVTVPFSPYFLTQLNEGHV